MTKAPNSRVNLDKSIERQFGTGARFVEARSILANAIVGQFLPDGVAKGGSALKLRFGAHGFRATRDLDAARRGDIADFERILNERQRAASGGMERFHRHGRAGTSGASAGRSRRIRDASVRSPSRLQRQIVVHGRT